MRRSPALILLLVVVLALALWWLATGGGKDASVAPRGESDVMAGAPAAAPPLEPAAASAADIARADAPAQPEAAAGPGRRLTVRVILADGRGPAAGAEVLLLPVEAHKRLVTAEYVQYQQANYDEKLDRWGKVYACDATGVATVPMPESGWFPVGARLKDLWGSRNVREEERDAIAEIEIELQPAIHLRVLVVNESRQPVAGIKVAYRALDGLIGGNLEEAATGADGIAHLRHLQEEYQRNSGRGHDHVVAIALPFEPTVQAAFDPLSPPAEPIVLVLPGTGFVEVQVFDVTGQPVEGLSVMLQKQMGPEQRRCYSPPRGMMHQSWLGLLHAPTVQGIARFEQVGLGLTLEYGADFESSRVIESGSGPGPQRPGETVRFVLRQTASAPVITGRIVNIEGLPLPGFDFSPDIFAAGEHHSVARPRVKTDAEGRFRCPLDLDPTDARPKILMCIQERPGEVLLLITDVPAPLAAGVTDLGDLVLGGPLLVSGVVLTPGGEPAPTAYGSVGPPQKLFSSPDEKRPYDSISWKAGADGRFEIRGNLPERQHEIQAWISDQRDWRLAPQRFARGASGLELRFQQPPGVRGRVLADAGVSVQDLSIGLMHEGGGTGTSPQADDGSFTLLIENPGIYDLEIRAFWTGYLLFAQRGLSLAKGGSMDVGDIDLRGLPRTRIVVLDPDGQPVPRAGILILDGMAQVSRFSRPMDMPITLLHTHEQRTVLLEAAGFARQEVALTGGEQTVRLTPGISISLTLEGLPPAPEGWSWQINLTQRGDLQFPDSYVRQSVASGSNQIGFELPVSGNWMARLVLASTNSSGEIQRAFGDMDPVIEVRPGQAHQEYRLLVNAEAVALGISKR